MREVYSEIAAAPWNYQSEPLYRVVATRTSDYGMISLHVDFATVAEAMAHFVRFNIGPLQNRSVGLVDGNSQFVVGYRVDGGDCEWFGTAEGFTELARHHDPMTVAVWEVRARCGEPPPNEIPVEDTVR